MCQFWHVHVKIKLNLTQKSDLDGNIDQSWTSTHKVIAGYVLFNYIAFYVIHVVGYISAYQPKIYVIAGYVSVHP